MDTEDGLEKESSFLEQVLARGVAAARSGPEAMNAFADSDDVKAAQLIIAQPVDKELFDRTAPKWNCIDYADGMHYMSRGTCRWCGKTAAAIKALEVPPS